MPISDKLSTCTLNRRLNFLCRAAPVILSSMAGVTAPLLFRNHLSFRPSRHWRGYCDRVTLIVTGDLRTADEFVNFDHTRSIGNHYE